MIDTIVLTLYEHHDFVMLEPNKFKSAKNFGNKSYASYIQNPTKEEILLGNYKPRLTYIERQSGSRPNTLRVEFSAPKLLFGNNFDELKNDDIEKVAEMLKVKLKTMGILVYTQKLLKAKVSAIHYSKNFILTNYATSSMILNELYKIDLTERLDLNYTKFRNGGHALTYHANSFEFVAYDKLKDLEQAEDSEKRAIESDNIVQLDLFGDNQPPKPFEVLRIEARLNTQRKIKQMLGKIGIDVELTFKNLFKEEIAQKILKLYWDAIEENISPFSLNIKQPYDLLEEILISNPRIRPTKALKLVGALAVMQDSGMRKFKNMFKSSGKKMEFYKLLGDIKQLKVNKNRKYTAVSKIREEINDLKPVKLKDFETDNKS